MSKTLKRRRRPSAGDVTETRHRSDAFTRSAETCRQCGAEGVPVVVFRKTETWCRPCRAKVVAQYPPLTQLSAHRPRVTVRHAGMTYHFDSKHGARVAMRALLKTRRLPPALAAQINGCAEEDA